MIGFISAQLALFALAFLGVLIPFYGRGLACERPAVDPVLAKVPHGGPGFPGSALETPFVDRSEHRLWFWTLAVQAWGRGIAAGVLLSAALVHILPASAVQLRAGLTTIRESSLDTALSVQGASVLIGVLGVYSLDLRVRRYSERPGRGRDARGTVSAVRYGALEPTNTSQTGCRRQHGEASLLCVESFASEAIAPKDTCLMASREHDEVIESSIWKVLLCSLSFHALSEGFALGLSRSNTFLMLYLAIIFHKFFAGFALGVSIACTGAPFRHQLSAAALFAAATPLAASLARLSASWGDLSDQSRAFVQIGGGLMNGLAAGSFMAISLLELLPVPAGASSSSRIAPLSSTTPQERELCINNAPSDESFTTAIQENQIQGTAMIATRTEEAHAQRALLPLLLSAAGFSLLAIWI